MIDTPAFVWRYLNTINGSDIEYIPLKSPLRGQQFFFYWIGNLQLSREKFNPINYNVQNDFKDSFGIINGTDEEPEEVILSFTPREGRYVGSLPLHSSQELIEENEKEIKYRYFIRLTYDFKMEILSYGDQLLAGM